jgi:hypothetical protein
MSGNPKRNLPREVQEPEVRAAVQEKPTDSRIRTIRRELAPVPDTLHDFLGGFRPQSGTLPAEMLRPCHDRPLLAGK